MNNIKYLIIDVDGTLTDGQLYIGASGEIMKAFNVKDGYGIRNILPLHEITPVVFTGRISPIVERRCLELDIKEVFQNEADKKSALFAFINSHKTAPSQLAYIGDDLNDLECMIEIKKGKGLVACPNNAEEALKNIADFVSSFNGGYGAVRDFINWIVK